MALNEKPVFLTAEGRIQLQKELAHLINVRRQEVASMIGAAAEDGDLSENAAYDHAKEEQAMLEGKIATLEQYLRNVVLIENQSSTTVNLGSTITINDNGEEDTYTIVGALEASPASGRISNESPIGRALMMHKMGDLVQVDTPGGPRAVRIISIK